tara:strand:+ start:95 stop:337 length:243 start_codon:yes stop_codon:yes gene_type:complete
MTNEFEKYATGLDDNIRLGIIVGRFEDALEDKAKRKDVTKLRTQMRASFEELEKNYKERVDSMIQYYDRRTMDALRKVKK